MATTLADRADPPILWAFSSWGPHARSQHSRRPQLEHRGNFLLTKSALSDVVKQNDEAAKQELIRNNKKNHLAAVKQELNEWAHHPYN